MMTDSAISRRNVLVRDASLAGAAIPLSGAAGHGRVVQPTTGNMSPPKFEFAFQIAIELGKRVQYGPTFWGLDRGYVGVLGGTVKGPRLNGTIVPHSGGDWPTVRPDNVVRFDARYLIQADDGTIIQLQNSGLRYADPAVLERMRKYEHVEPSEYYMGLTPRFDAPVGKHDWLSRTIFIGKADRGEGHSIFTYWAMV